MYVVERSAKSGQCLCCCLRRRTGGDSILHARKKFVVQIFDKAEDVALVCWVHTVQEAPHHVILGKPYDSRVRSAPTYIDRLGPLVLQSIINETIGFDRLQRRAHFITTKPCDDNTCSLGR
ncbi:hypothetical protein D3C87_1799180 [compost metagenome]